uniref:Uncharacterized protein n=1 Tax=Rhodnius prolixus TaxID=13249 RepID=T1HE56_RHOPR
MYLEGIDMNLGNLYPKVDYPVSRNVPSLCQLLTWENVTSPLFNYFKKSLGYFLVMEIYNNTNKDGQRSFVMESVNFKTEQVNDTNFHSDIYTLLQKGVGEFEVNLESVTLASGQIKQ